MTAEEFISLLRKSKCLMDEARIHEQHLCIESFFKYYERYKHYIFQGYSQECIDSSSFRDNVWQAMCLVLYTEQDKTKTSPKSSIPSNVVNFNKYAKRRAYI